MSASWRVERHCPNESVRKTKPILVGGVSSLSNTGDHEAWIKSVLFAHYTWAYQYFPWIILIFRDPFHVVIPVTLVKLFLVALETDHNRWQFLIYLYFFLDAFRSLRSARCLDVHWNSWSLLAPIFFAPSKRLASCNRHHTSAFEIAPRHQNTLVGPLKSFSSTSISNVWPIYHYIQWAPGLYPACIAAGAWIWALISV